MGQKFAGFDSNGAIVAFFDSEDSPAPEGTDNLIEISDDEWRACLVTPGYTVLDGELRAPSPAALLAQAQATKMSALHLDYLTASQIDVTYKSASGVATRYQADSESQARLLVATTGYGLSGATPTGFYWVARDNTQVPFTLDDLKGLYGVMLVQGNTEFNKLQTLKAKVRTAETVESVGAITWG
ncbi:hypothetical protein PBR20603_04376 [Pandoraea bronchicola]|uniref:DUF4376 domain-containing protein n=2 Tax=Pandoraea bronchicola TaxID=2508287 RepID=A0A5E5BZ56_9BURK|nr:hypothetical protein PBR20603_04376 [Pandoraea bronchicola]